MYIAFNSPNDVCSSTVSNIQKFFNQQSFYSSYQLTNTSGLNKKSEEKDEKLTVQYCLPNIPKENISIKVSGDNILVEVKESDLSFSPKSFTDSINLKHYYNVDKIESKLENGVLDITIPFKSKFVKDIEIS